LEVLFWFLYLLLERHAHGWKASVVEKVCACALMGLVCVCVLMGLVCVCDDGFSVCVSTEGALCVGEEDVTLHLDEWEAGSRQTQQEDPTTTTAAQALPVSTVEEALQFESKTLVIWTMTV
jgi:hypothetical protein